WRCRAASTQFEAVAVQHRGEAFAVRGQLGAEQGGGAYDLVFAAFAGGIAEEVDDGAVASVVDVVAVGADAVEAGDVAEVLDGAGAQQGLPGVGAGCGPVGDEELQVEVEGAGAFDVKAVAGEDGEAQVVADERADAPTFPFDGEAVAAGGVAFVFAGVAEEV